MSDIITKLFMMFCFWKNPPPHVSTNDFLVRRGNHTGVIKYSKGHQIGVKSDVVEEGELTNKRYCLSHTYMLITTWRHICGRNF